MSPTLAFVASYKQAPLITCGGDSDCAACAERLGQRSFEESRKHAGSTRRCQISRPDFDGFHPVPKFRQFSPSLPCLANRWNHRLHCLTAQRLAIMHARHQPCQWAIAKISSRNVGLAAYDGKRGAGRGMRENSVLPRHPPPAPDPPALLEPIPVAIPVEWPRSAPRGRLGPDLQASKVPIVPTNRVVMGRAATWIRGRLESNMTRAFMSQAARACWHQGQPAAQPSR